MTVKVVTDSTADLPPELARMLGITVVPVYVHFGRERYRDGVDMDPAQFYGKLAESPNHPTTSQPSVGDFMNTYNNLIEQGATSVVSVHISSKISGTFSSAQKALEMAKAGAKIEVLDSGFNSIGLGLISLAAARMAQAGENLQNVVSHTRQAIDRTDMLGMFDTLKYMLRGGRISRTKATVASIIGVKPMLKFSQGTIVQAGLARTYKKGMGKLVDFVRAKKGILSLGIAHSAIPEEARKLKQRLGQFTREEDIVVTELGPALGVHGGPGVLLVAVQSE